MTDAGRLSAGGLIDRTKPLKFSFDGRVYEGFEGDTLASALLANGVRLVGRSFKYHRPRGIVAAGAEEPNALVSVGEGPDAVVNLRATEVVLHNGLIARPINCWPSLRFDVGAINGIFGRFLLSGFYYKTFMWPDWHLFEWAIRRAAGLGKPSADPDPDAYDTVYAHCDVLVVGAGPSGMAAARAAASSGARVILVEQDFAIGGSLLWDDARIDGLSSRQWLALAEQQIRRNPEARILSATTAIGYFDHNEIVLVERLAVDAVKRGAPRERIWQVRAKRVVLATGAIERPLVFSGNDRPGIMLSQAVRQYVRRFAVRIARRAVVVTNNDDAYQTATALAESGTDVACIVDLRRRPPADLVDIAKAQGIAVHAGAEILGTRGGRCIRAVQLRIDGQVQNIPCDLLAMSGGMSPVVHLHTQSGGGAVYDEALLCFVPARSVQAEESVGAAAGVFTLSRALKSAHESGRRAAEMAGFSAGKIDPPSTGAERANSPPEPFWSLASGGDKAFVDFQNDVGVEDIALAARENYVSVEHLKRYTTLGMATDQGKTSNLNALAIMAGLTGRNVGEGATTRNRFPYTPTSIGAFGGPASREHFRPLRRMPVHQWHEDQGAKFEEYGGWLRPACYLRDGETPHDAEQREARAVREAVGLFEGSPLGKIEIKGPDSAKFLDRLYANTMSTLKPGKIRYGLMLNELGVLLDDGVVARLADDHFLIGTTGAGASRMAEWIEEWLQCEWPDFDVVSLPVTTSWAVLTLTGPNARNVLADADVDTALGAEAFPHMTYRDAYIGDAPVRILRVSFTGEASYEINVPTREASSLWTRLIAAGQKYGITPVGIDAWMLLRTEKGFLHIGADTDGTTVPDDVGWGHVSKKKSDFIGKRSLSMSDKVHPGRLQLVGAECLTSDALPIGCHFRRAQGASEGYVTSAGFSPVLGKGVALAMVSAGRARMGEVFDVYANGPTGLKAKIVPLCAYDPEGTRLHA
jgi:sarcosine oxidase subunit alpha